MNNEFKWVNIPFFSNYQINEKGDVRSFFGSYRLRKASIATNGYLGLILREKNKSYYRYVHHLVAETFLGVKPTKETFILHKDGNKLNNEASNLKVVPRNSILPGVTQATNGKFAATVNRKHIGVFNSPKEAHEAYKKKKKL